NRRVLKGKDIQHDILLEYKTSISYQQAWRGKDYGLNQIRGSPYESFEMLPYYYYNLDRKNQGSVIRIKTVDKGVFEMLFIALGASGAYKDANLVAIRMDGNNQIVPVAFVHAGNAAGCVNPAAEFTMMGISPKAKIKKQEWEVKFVESLARFDKWEESSKNLAKLLYRSMSTRTKLGLGFKEYIGSAEVCDLSTPSVFDPEPENRKVTSLYESDKSSASETYDFTSCVSNPKTNDFFSTVDVKILPKSDVKDPCPTNGFPSCSFKENVTPTRNLCNKSGLADRIYCKNNFVHSKKCFVCGSKSHLIKDCDVYDTVDNFPSVVLKAASVPTGSRHSSASTSAGSFIPTASRNRPASIHAGRSIPAASRNRPTSIHVGRSIPAASRNRPSSIHAGRSIPAASRNRPASIHASRHFLAGRINKPAPFPADRYVPTSWSNPVHPHMNKDIGIVDSGCSRSMTGNKKKLDDLVQVKGGTVTFGGGDGKIT
nr:hypothetical protein [Tanacetum cinerariifolium]